VRAHFAYLAAIVRAHGGAIVKTIGDAILAAFLDPAAALAAAIEMQREVGRFNAAQEGRGIVLKVGLHDGPVIAVTLNDRLDYFGATVNLAARLQAESRGGDVVLSRVLAADPGVAAQLDRQQASEEQARLKGFDRPVDFLRLTFG
jgi:class 3 adenylate cyclase